MFKIKLAILRFFQFFLKKINFKLYYSKDKKVLNKLKVEKIVDIGVAKGTRILLENFPDAEFFFVEANKDYYDYIENNLLKHYKGKLFKIAAGEKNDIKKINISGPISSFYERENFEFSKSYEVKVKKLDDILENEKIFENTLLKIDCEGAELEILKGSIQTLNKVNYVIVEIRLQKINTYNPSEIISYLYKNNFVWLDMLEIYYAKEGVDYIDILFKRLN
tara:strand:+ start:135 stop:797 length:663 start_codon:yes stop_codon:yes gene_type:complete